MSGLRATPTVRLSLDAWTKIIVAAKDSDDHRLRALIEQAVAEAKIGPVPG